MVGRAVLDWLLDEAEPSVRFRTLTEVLGRSEDDPEVQEARRSIGERGWVRQILNERTSRAAWADGSSPYRPKYLSTHWRMLVLADLRAPRTLPGLRESVDYWTQRMAARGGRLGGNSKGTPHYCVSANMARALLQFGYTEDPRVRRTLDWLVDIADPKGGWSCFGLGRNLDSWEALSAFAYYPRPKWNARMLRCVELGAEYYLERHLNRQGARYPPWSRFHYPVHYYYDVLVGLDFLTRLGYGDDRRLAPAMRLLHRKRRRDGRWNLDAVHPDVMGPIAAWMRAHPKDRPTPWSLERIGRASKMITLIALGVVQRVSPTGRRAI